MATTPMLATIAEQSASQTAGAVASVVPSGAIMSYAGSSAPTGWLLCDGAVVSRTTFSSLFAVIGTTFGVGDGSTTFNLPDLRGRFVRYDDNMGTHGLPGISAAGSAGRDSARTHGSTQTQTTAANGLGGTAAGQTQGATTTALASGSAASNGDHWHYLYQGSAKYVDGGASFYGMGATAQSAAITHTTGAHTHTVSGNTSIGHTHSSSAVTTTGDTETRPINIALNAIIKV